MNYTTLNDMNSNHSVHFVVLAFQMFIGGNNCNKNLYNCLFTAQIEENSIEEYLQEFLCLENTFYSQKYKAEPRFLFDYSLQVQNIYSLIEVTRFKRLIRHSMHV